MFDWVKRRRNKPTDENQKQLPKPDLFPCGICDKNVERKDLYNHWFEHTVSIPQTKSRAGTDSPMRSSPRQCSMVFIVRRPAKFPRRSEPFMDTVRWITLNPFEDMELAIAEYFANVINLLKQKWPGTRFQYQPTNITEHGWQTLLIIAEWDEE